MYKILKYMIFKFLEHKIWHATLKVGLLEVLNIIWKFFNFKSKYFQYVNSKARCVQSSSSSMYKVFDMLIERYEVPFSFKYKWFSFRIFEYPNI